MTLSIGLAPGTLGKPNTDTIDRALGHPCLPQAHVEDH